MTSEIIPFTFQQYSIRTAFIEGEPWVLPGRCMRCAEC